VFSASVWLAWPWVSWVWRLAIAGLLVGLGATSLLTWLFLQPVTRHLWCRGRLWWIRHNWNELAVQCGVAFNRQHQSTAKVNRPAAIPRLRSGLARWPRISLLVRPVMGQTLAEFEDASARLRTAVGASHLRVEPSGTRDVQLTFTIGDGLSRPFDFHPSGCDDVRRVRMGLLDDGSPWYLPVGPHTLVAGCSGSGKGSLFWSFAFGLGPAVRDGRVQLHGIDLKGGMEVLMGKGLFTTYATSAAEAVVVLEQLVRWMQDRTRNYAGRVRSHDTTRDEPLHVVMIDELAALTAYCPHRDLQRRAEMAINLLCSQGRAPGFVVFACLQDPRKEVIPSRGLFTQMVGLRLKDASETAMVLGEHALTSGAHCHRITRHMPGTGYVIPEDGGYPIRVRAGFASDPMIRQVATRFATPIQEPIPALQVPDDPPTRARQARSKGAA
jgi:S-DNA-T family DNA segregation ATPase FtsK/SpoIIIE